MRFKQRLLCSLLTLLCVNGALAKEWQTLLDPELSQWHSYLSFKHNEDYNGDAPTDANGKHIAPIGLNNDPYGVFSVSEQHGELVLRISGEYYGCLFTKQTYENYHLTLQVKWGDKKWAPRKHRLKDSGVLYHSVGEPGAEYWRTWMLSQEFQIMEGHMGDYWNQASSAIDIRAIPPEYVMSPIADHDWPFIPIGHGSPHGGYAMRSHNTERPHGDWNTLELITFNGRSLHIVNGKVVMVLRNSHYLKNGEAIALDKGRLQIQSEAAEVYFKAIQLKPIETLPTRFQQYF